jgi:3-deoxy-D-manno-octulosonic-acid transferase
MQLISLLLYNLSIGLYGAGIFIASFFNPKARLWIEGRKKQVVNVPANGGKRIWVHCASLGEFEQARPVTEKIKSSNTTSFIILSFFSPSGYEIRKNYTGADLVLYLPLDTSNNARTFISQIKPDLALFVKYEFWYHYITELKNRKIPVVLFSAIFRKEQIFFKWYGSLFRTVLNCFDKIFVQNKESKDLLNSISISSEVSFDTRFDRVFQISQSAKNFPLIEKFKGDSKVLIFGSTWLKDEVLFDLILSDLKDFENIKFIIAPHNLTEAGLNNLNNRLQAHNMIRPVIGIARLSQLTPDNAATTNVLVVDTMGDLSSIYRYADIAYVGGAFNASVHNVLEPAVYGLPVIFGPNYSKSAEAKELIEARAAFSIVDFNQLKTAVLTLNNNTAAFNNATSQSAQYVKQRLGGIDDIYRYIALYL